ncbi:BZ3500_MvSof-1268-A1-R1_C100g00549 [Microbotryum saponariae]|uniref:BZ3500_MvSof-1268-A1-R1_C100g00549 protein n=1 Tax=Microbotryum saponariae TaxID=289078 RepID=A0A2X0L300_9BASI|nr:BZ3500_MvSof-1268-A1-R1_C100g00549 [Microbotryum saponariae]
MSPVRPELPRFPAAAANPTTDAIPAAPDHTEPPDATDGTMSSSAHVDDSLAARIDERIHLEVQRRLREFSMSPTPDRKPLHNIDIPRHLSTWPADALLSDVGTFRIWDRTLQDRVGATIYTYITTGTLPDRADAIDRENVEIFAVRQVSDGVAGNVRKSLLTVASTHERARAYYEHLDREYNPTSSQSTLRLLHSFFNIPRAPIEEKGFVEWMTEFLDQSNCLESAQITITDVITARALTLIPDELDAFRQYMELHNTDQLPTPSNLMALAHKQVKNHHDTRNASSTLTAFAATPSPSSSSSKPKLPPARYLCPACKTGLHRVRDCPDDEARQRYIDRRNQQQQQFATRNTDQPEDEPVVATVSRFQDFPEPSTSAGQNCVRTRGGVEFHSTTSVRTLQPWAAVVRSAHFRLGAFAFAAKPPPHFHLGAFAFAAKPSPSCLAPACSTHARAPPPPRRDSGRLPSSLAEPMPPLSHQQLAAAVLMFHRPSRVSPMHDARRSQPESRRYGLPRSPTLDIESTLRSAQDLGARSEPGADLGARSEPGAPAQDLGARSEPGT